MQERIILVVDDEVEERKIFCKFLGFAGFSVVEAENGAEALRMAEEHGPSLILLDISMPVLDGWGAIERLKGDPKTASIPVLALTAFRLDREHLGRAGFSGYIEKPVGPYQVLEEVERRLGPGREGEPAGPQRTPNFTQGFDA